MHAYMKCLARHQYRTKHTVVVCLVLTVPKVYRAMVCTFLNPVKEQVLSQDSPASKMIVKVETRAWSVEEAVVEQVGNTKH
jgi:hypothetical protein